MDGFQDEIDKNHQNVYANTVAGKSIHISEAESGRKGYFCQGCNNIYEAVRHTKSKRQDYFRHVVEDKSIEKKKCTYSDEKFRHQIAQEYLGRNKYIKVPSVYKFPPRVKDGIPNLLVDSYTVEAHSLEVNRVFYEDEFGKIKWGSFNEVDEKDILAKPAVVFFDINKNPILLIEFVANHKVDNEKKIKLRQVHIDTIAITIPKDSQEGIEKALYSIKRIKWLYNNVEQSANYIPIPIGSSTEIPELDELQKRFFAETYECRQSEINNLIRTITRILGAEQFRKIVGDLGEKLSGIRSLTEEHQSQLDGLREEHRNRAIKSTEQQEEEFRKEFEKFEQQHSDFQLNSWNLENRYFAKRSEIKSEQASVDRITTGESEGGGGLKDRLERRRTEIERLTAELQVDIRKEESEIDSIQREEDGLPERFKQFRESVIAKFAALETSEKREMEEFGREEAGLPTEFEEKEGKLPAEFERNKERLRVEFEGAREELNKTAQSADGKGNTQLHFRIRGLLEAKQLLYDIRKAQSDYRRNRKAWESFKDGSFQNWAE